MLKFEKKVRRQKVNGEFELNEHIYKFVSLKAMLRRGNDGICVEKKPVTKPYVSDWMFRAGLYGVVVTVSAVELRFCPGFW